MAGDRIAREKTTAIEQSAEITARLAEAREALEDVILSAIALQASIPRLEQIAIQQVAFNLTRTIDRDQLVSA